jgi:pilus assembly protein Flp/PilA
MLSDIYLRLREKLKSVNEEGQGMLEYALILVLIAVVVIVVLTTVGHRVSNTFSTISNTFNRTN